MAFSKVSSAQIDGLDPHIVTIETDISRGLFSFSLVGLPDKAVEESRDRVSAAIQNSGFKSHKQKNEKVVVALAPAELKKTGPVFDLGIALGYLLSAEEINFNPEDKLFLGELSLDGSIRPINGVLSAVLHARKLGFKEIFVPQANADEAALISGVSIFSPDTLIEAVSHLDPSGTIKRNNAFQKGGIKSPKKQYENFKSLLPHQLTTFEDKAGLKELQQRSTLKDIRGQENAKRALEIAAAGGHNILLFGPPGTGKTLLAKAFAELLPKLPFDDALEVTAIHSASGTLIDTVVTHPPFRAPHHTSSYVSIVGGGAYPRPGEITLAHKGVLFLDEFPEFDKRVIESLREPLEERSLTISRSQKTSRFPADVILIAAMNPCPCGNRGSSKECRCAPKDLARYERKLSGPIMDRIDLWVEVGEITLSKLRKVSSTEKKADEKTEKKVRARIARALSTQALRYKKDGVKNAHLNPRTIHKNIKADESVYTLLENAAEELNLTARGYHKMLKVARTIADLEGSKNLKEEHLLEALQYRQKPLFL
ncbi:MAG: YifB family Mg chelatase-like AAA ATPase [Candidatus Paceibacterota bacterium]